MLIRIVGHGTLRTAISTCVREYESECVNCCCVVSTSSEKHVSRAKWKNEKKNNFLDCPRPYTYFDFCFDVAGEPLIHPRRNRVVVIRVLDLHDALHCVSFSARDRKRNGAKEKREKRGATTTKNRSQAALRIHSANDITRPRTSSRCDTLTFPPPRFAGFQGSGGPRLFVESHSTTEIRTERR